MIDFLGYAPMRGYFAAYNGYNGFKSLFDPLFDPKRHDRVFILKGGPGTGKSTLLKGLIKWGNNKGAECDAVYCSSDPSSLDGVIIRKGEKSVAMLDGTSPHIYDPKFPGAKDEIINLGDAFNTDMLISKANIITSLGTKKSEAYSDAYSCLKIAGEIKRAINELYDRALDRELISDITESIYDRLSDDEISYTHDVYCISSFSRQGYTRLDDVYKGDRTVIGLLGNGYTEYKVMKSLASRLTEQNRATVICPSPFGDGEIEAIYTENYMIITGNPADIDIDTTPILKSEPDIRGLQDLYNSALVLSKDSFKSASEWHFKLEDIYSDCMDFKNNDTVFDNITEKIESIFG